MKVNLWTTRLLGAAASIAVAGLFAVSTLAAPHSASTTPQTPAQQEIALHAARSFASKDPQVNATDPTAPAYLAGVVTFPAVTAAMGGIGLVVVIALVGAAITERLGPRRRARPEASAQRPRPSSARVRTETAPPPVVPDHLGSEDDAPVERRSSPRLEREIGKK